MKYFFIPTKENLKNASFIHKMWEGKELPLIDNEETLKAYIQNNRIKDYRKIPCFRVGSLVKLISERSLGWSPNGEMDRYLNQEVVITHLTSNQFKFGGDKTWYFMPCDIAEVIKY